MARFALSLLAPRPEPGAQQLLELSLSYYSFSFFLSLYILVVVAQLVISILSLGRYIRRSQAFPCLSNVSHVLHLLDVIPEVY